MSKSRDAFRTISEVADWLDTPAHVLRFWESKFTQVKPVKRAGGRRYYRPEDTALLGGIKSLLHDQGMTIKGAQKLLREKGVKFVASLGPSAPGEADAELIEAEIAPETATVVELTPRPSEPPEALDLVDAAELPEEPQEEAEEPSADADGDPADEPEAAPEAIAAPAEPSEDLPTEATLEPDPEDEAAQDAVASETSEEAPKEAPGPSLTVNLSPAPANSPAEPAAPAEDVWDKVADEAAEQVAEEMPLAATLDGDASETPDAEAEDAPDPSAADAAEAPAPLSEEPAPEPAETAPETADPEAPQEAPQEAPVMADADAWDGLAAYRPSTPMPELDQDRHPLTILSQLRPGALAHRKADLAPIMERLGKIADAMSHR